MRIEIHIFTSIYFWKKYSSVYVYVLVLAFWGRWHCVTDVACPSSLVGTTLGGFPFPPFSPFSLFLGIYGWRNILSTFTLSCFSFLYIFLFWHVEEGAPSKQAFGGQHLSCFPQVLSCPGSHTNAAPIRPNQSRAYHAPVLPFSFETTREEKSQKGSLVMGFHLIIVSPIPSQIKIYFWPKNNIFVSRNGNNEEPLKFSQKFDRKYLLFSKWLSLM